jgi:hypothetical protein
MGRRIIFLLAFTIFAIVSGQSLFAAEEYIQAKIFFDNKDTYSLLLQKHLDVIDRGDDYFEVITNSSQLDELKSLSIRTEILHKDLGAFYRSRLAKDRTMGGYKTLSEIEAYIDTIITNYPTIVSTKYDIGQTIEGRTMWAVKISDNPMLDEDEPEILLTACIHAREVITPEVLLYYMDYLTQNYGTDPDVTQLVDNREIWFVNPVNPDGYYYNQVTDPNGGGMWRKNRRYNGDGTYGVDINRNYGYEWGYDNSGSSPYTYAEDYRGTGPFSEPESQNMRDFIEAHEFVITVYYHSSGNYFLYPWGYETILTPDNDIFAAMGDTINSMNGYAPGTPWEVLYPVNGSTDDWGYAEQMTKNKNFAVSFEVGSSSDGFWPSVSRIPALCQENLGPNLFLTRLAGNIYQLQAPEPPIMSAPDTALSSGYEIAWSLDDTLNPAVLYELIELMNLTEGYTDSANNLDNWINHQFSTSTTRYHSSPSSFYSGSGDNFNRHIQTSSAAHVSTGDSLRCWMYYDIETDWDYAYAEASMDGVNFTTLPGNVTTDYDPHGNNRGNGITGASGGWVQASFSLENYYNKHVYFRFTYQTDSYVTEEGFYVDDIYPLDVFGTTTVLSSTYGDTTYSFTDKTPGTYYYKVRGQDAEQQWSSYSNVAKTVVVENPQIVCGDADNNQMVNILDVIYLIKWLYVDGPPPLYPQSGDVDNSGEVNIFDLTDIIDFLYRNGPDLTCPEK